MYRAYHQAYALVLFTESQVTEQSVQLPKEFLVAYSVGTINTNMCFPVTTPCNVYTPRPDDHFTETKESKRMQTNYHITKKPWFITLPEQVKFSKQFKYLRNIQKVLPI